MKIKTIKKLNLAKIKLKTKEGKKMEKEKESAKIY